MRRGSQLRATSYLAAGLAMGAVLLGFGPSLHVDGLRGAAATAFAPAQSVLSGLGDGVRGLLGTLTSIGDLRSDNDHLRQQVTCAGSVLGQALTR